MSEDQRRMSQKGREAIEIMRKRGDKWIFNINIGKYLQHCFSFTLFFIHKLETIVANKLL